MKNPVKRMITNHRDTTDAALNAEDEESRELDDYESPQYW
jgi:hypothetical protein